MEINNFEGKVDHVFLDITKREYKIEADIFGFLIVITHKF